MINEETKMRFDNICLHYVTGVTVEESEKIEGTHVFSRKIRIYFADDSYTTIDCQSSSYVRLNCSYVPVYCVANDDDRFAVLQKEIDSLNAVIRPEAD